MHMWEDFINEVEQTGLSFDEFLSLYKLYSFEKNTRQINYQGDRFKEYINLEAKGLVKIITNEEGVIKFILRENGDTLMQRFAGKNIPVKKDPTVITEIKKETNKDDKFEEFWSIFPSSDEHGIYRKTRVLKASKDMCKKKYFVILAGGTKHEDVLKALNYELKMRKDSGNKGNNMMYMKNSLTWLNQREFEIILETMSEDDTTTSQDDWTSNSI